MGFGWFQKSCRGVYAKNFVTVLISIRVRFFVLTGLRVSLRDFLAALASWLWSRAFRGLG